MAKLSDVSTPKLTYDEGSAAATPASGKVVVYAKTDGLMYSKDDAGAETLMSGGAGGASTSVLINEPMNFPSLEKADNTQPEWWEVSANATLTEVDIAGESITETWERGFKLVTTAADAYGYQRFTYADQPRLKSGRTVSARVAVWSVSSAAARINLTSSAGELGVSSDTTAASWTILTVEGKVLNGTYVDLRFECDNGTAYFVPLAFGVGSTASNELPQRGLAYRWVDSPTEIKSLTALNDEDTWTDIDCTAASSNLAAVAVCTGILFNDDANEDFALYVRRNGSSTAKGNNNERIRALGSAARQAETEITVILDDGQVFEYLLDRTAGSGALDFGAIFLAGYWEWA